MAMDIAAWTWACRMDMEVHQGQDINIDRDVDMDMDTDIEILISPNMTFFTKANFARFYKTFGQISRNMNLKFRRPP